MCESTVPPKVFAQNIWVHAEPLRDYTNLTLKIGSAKPLAEDSRYPTRRCAVEQRDSAGPASASHAGSGWAWTTAEPRH